LAKDVKGVPPPVIKFFRGRNLQKLSAKEKEKEKPKPYLHLSSAGYI
jgi:hypothetical protein